MPERRQGSYIVSNWHCLHSLGYATPATQSGFYPKGHLLLTRRTLLPQVPVYILVSIIPETFGGMITVALQRASAFADLDNRKIEILTKSPNMVDQDVRTQQLRRSGQMSDNVRIRNVWSDLETGTAARIGDI